MQKKPTEHPAAHYMYPAASSDGLIYSIDIELAQDLLQVLDFLEDLPDKPTERETPAWFTALSKGAGELGGWCLGAAGGLFQQLKAGLVSDNFSLGFLHQHISSRSYKGDQGRTKYHAHKPPR